MQSRYHVVFRLDGRQLVGAGADGHYIAYDGSSDYTILLPESPQPAESTAATELSTILGQVTGATIDVVAENRARDVSTEGNFISVGETQLYKEQEFKAENLNTDGFLIKTVDNTLFIIGENQRGTLYGVYEFLEREAAAVSSRRRTIISRRCRDWVCANSTSPRSPRSRPVPTSMADVL